MFHAVCLSPRRRSTFNFLLHLFRLIPSKADVALVLDCLALSVRAEPEIAQFNVSGSPPSCSMELFVPYPCPSVLHSSSSWLIHKGCQQILPDLNPLVCIFALNYTQPSSLRPLLSYFSFTLSADIVYG